MQALGLTVDKIQPIKDFEVINENWQALQVFLSCTTQWRYAGMGQPVGIDYSALQSVMTMLKTEDQAKTFKDVQCIEQGALNAMAKQK